MKYDLSEYHNMVNDLAKPGQAIIDSLTPGKAHVWHMASCAQGEVGELFDAVKKWIIYDAELTDERFENIKEELGDIFFYLQGIMNHFGFTLEMIKQHNINKLSKRYFDGYSDKAAQERKDKENKYEKGKRVQLVKSSGMRTGIIKQITTDGALPVLVLWNDGMYGHYQYGDLVLM